MSGPSVPARVAASATILLILLLTGLLYLTRRPGPVVLRLGSVAGGGVGRLALALPPVLPLRLREPLLPVAGRSRPIRGRGWRAGGCDRPAGHDPGVRDPGHAARGRLRDDQGSGKPTRSRRGLRRIGGRAPDGVDGPPGGAGHEELGGRLDGPH